MPDEETIDCTQKEFEAGYDSKLGIDVILRPVAGGEGTLQEKFLFTDYNTVTIEHCQDWLTLEKGDFYKLRANYYFVGYDPTGCLQFDPWVLLDWSCLQRVTAQYGIGWHLRGNFKDKARASFMWIFMDELPPEICVDSSIPKLRHRAEGKAKVSQQPNFDFSTPAAPPAATATTAPPESDDELEQLRLNWRQLLLEAPPDMSRTPAAALLRSAKPKAIEENTVILSFKFPVHKENMEKPENQQIAEKTISNFLGRSCRVRCICEPEDNHLIKEALKMGAQIIDTEGK